MKIEAKQRLITAQDDKAKWDAEVIGFMQQHGKMSAAKAQKMFNQEQMVADNFYSRKQGPEQTALFLLYA